MMRATLLATALLALLTADLRAADAAQPPKRKSAQEIIDAAPASAWRDLDPANTLYMELPAGRVVIALAPGFAPEHVANIKTLGEDAGKAKPYPPGTRTHLPAEFTRSDQGVRFDRLPDIDGWAPQVGFVDGFPAGRDPKTGKVWMAHCYGVVGAGRNTPPDSSIGTELYVVIGQAPRALDHQLTVVGWVVKGMELLSVIPRGPAPMGFYTDPKQRTPILSIKLASEVPAAERTPLQLLRTDSQAFRDATEARRNRVDDFYTQPAGHIDLCNVPLPVRETPAAK
jgi:peptidylprolyl isomerase